MINNRSHPLNNLQTCWYKMFKCLCSPTDALTVFARVICALFSILAAEK
jgi:hypothetical protein